MRVGIGYDIHRFGDVAGPLRLGGIEIPHPRRLLGHSDADVLLHAVADALLGAIGGPDLGELFPSSDPRYREADSRQFVEQAMLLMQRAGWRVSNLDTVVIADEPKIVPHKPSLCASLGRLLGISEAQVGVKAKTCEGFAPGVDGIAVHAVVLLTRQ